MGRKRPNIIFIMCDDHAAHAISAYGSRINKTPNIDRIAERGARFDNVFCTNSICTPSRAAILTGTYNHVNGVRTLWDDLDNALPTFISDLKSAGYSTAMLGKWHLGHGPNSDPRHFDYWEVLPGQGDYINPSFHTAKGDVQYEGYVTTILTDLSLNWLESLDRDNPFCLLLHHKAPHLPWTPEPKYENLFEDEHIPEPFTLNDDYATKVDAVRLVEGMRIDKSVNMTRWWEKGQRPEGMSDDDYKKWIYQVYIKEYLRTVQSIDDSTGRVLDYLEANGLDDDTIVIYTSDQGFFLGDHGWYDKRYMYEESLRMPFLMQYPAEIKAGSVVKEIVTNVDFASTFCDYADVQPHEGVQGRSFRDVVRGQAPEDWQKAMYYRYWEHDDIFHGAVAHYGIRTDRYKLICYYADALDSTIPHDWAERLGLEGVGTKRYPVEWELLDLQEDPHELKNLYNDDTYGALREQLTQQLEELQRSVGDTAYVRQEENV